MEENPDIAEPAQNTSDILPAATATPRNVIEAPKVKPQPLPTNISPPLTPKQAAVLVSVLCGHYGLMGCYFSVEYSGLLMNRAPVAIVRANPTQQTGLNGSMLLGGFINKMAQKYPKSIIEWNGDSLKFVNPQALGDAIFIGLLDIPGVTIDTINRTLVKAGAPPIPLPPPANAMAGTGRQ